MKWDFAIGNPAYQEEPKNKGDRPNPVYNNFMEQAYKIADVVELVTPARFLFNAGQTPKAWNEKMLNDEHFKVLHYEPDATKVFPTTEIKGGVAITIRNTSSSFGPIKTFTAYPELNSIIKRITNLDTVDSVCVDSIIASQGLYRFTERFFEEYPQSKNLMGAGTGNKIVSNIIEKLPDVFVKDASDDSYMRILGRVNGKREYRYIKRII